MSQCKNCKDNLHNACTDKEASHTAMMLSSIFGEERCECFRASPGLHRTLAAYKRGKTQP